MANPKVLIIDDDQAMLDLTRFHLQSRGYEAAMAETAREGLELIATGGFNIALTDFSLPDLDGIELVKQIKETSPDTEIIKGGTILLCRNSKSECRRALFYCISQVRSCSI